MPYISQMRRKDLDTEIPDIHTPGELNYMITRMLIEYIRANKKADLSYGLVNEVLGALEGAKMEFYRRVVAPMEDQKKKLNGDVYE